jgi:hypothetical protein
MRLALPALAAVALAAAAACGGGSNPTSAPTNAASPAPTQVASPASPSAPSPAQTTQATIAPTLGSDLPSLQPTAPQPIQTPAQPQDLIPGGAAVVLTTPQSGVGTRPLLEWQPVDGAATYRVTVFDGTGRPYWAWEGDTPSAYFGGGAEALPDEAPGPILGAGMSWVVFAADADGVPIAASAITPIAP